MWSVPVLPKDLDGTVLDLTVLTCGTTLTSAVTVDARMAVEVAVRLRVLADQSSAVSVLLGASD